MPNSEVHEEPCEVAAEDGLVLIRVSDSVDVRLTPEAAEETSNRLLEAAMKARGQNYFSDRRK